MTQDFDGRFSRLRVPSDNVPGQPCAQYFEIREAGAAMPSKPEESAIIEQLDEVGDPKAAKARALFSLISGQEDAVFQWLETSAEHADLFYRDPLAALKKALPQQAEALGAL
ncbi:hypothetical protein [Paracoccus fistulariae]|uniref:Uncharacterized protein n=1 Tax=Paracoccus fistulariae TaxID=658446 RepID=A0ABY7SJX3_9RHOB|nr:hypothetical protein [Paracoccus fistulariae]MDB6183169.1 hypothetical protein [Paracoccus fistulariae]WCR07305.1 hypothetical protein JHX87_00100 [Paracoccus fistulariae]